MNWTAEAFHRYTLCCIHMVLIWRSVLHGFKESSASIEEYCHLCKIGLRTSLTEKGAQQVICHL